MSSIPHQGCVVAPDGSLKALWQSDPTVVHAEVPGSVIEDAEGNKRSRLTSEDVIVDLTTHFLVPEFQLLYRDWPNARARKDETGGWKFYLLLPTLQVNEAGDGIEQGEVFEDEHPIERVRARRIAAGLAREGRLWQRGLRQSDEPTEIPSLAALCAQFGPIKLAQTR